MLSISFFTTDKPGITWGISTIFAIICFFSRIETFSYGAMSFFITYLRRYTTIKGIEISKPIPIIKGIDIFYHSSLDRVKFCISGLIPEESRFLTTNCSSTVPNNFFSFCLFPIFFEKFWNFPKIYRSCRNSSFKVSESILIIVSHIENKIFV